MKLYIFVILAIAALAFAEEEFMEKETEIKEPETEYKETETELEYMEHKEPKEVKDMEWKAKYGEYPIDTIVPLTYEVPVYMRYGHPVAYRYDFPLAYRYRTSYDPEYFHGKYGYYP